MAKVKLQKQKKTTEYDYAYATGRIRELENSLMDEQSTMRLFEAQSIDEVKKVLSDNGYKISGSIENSVSEDLTSAYDLISSIIPDKEYVQAILLENDYHNLKVILKSIIANADESRESQELSHEGVNPDEELRKQEDISDILEDSKNDISIKNLEKNFARPSNYDPLDILKLVFDDTIPFQDKDIQDLIKEVLVEYKNENDPSVVDTLVDKKYYERLYNYAKLLDDEFFRSYVNLLTESINLGILLRTRKMGFDVNVFLKNLVPSHFKTKEEMLSLFDASDDVIASEYKDSAYESLGQIVPIYSKDGNAIKFAKQVDNLIISMIKETKTNLFGPQIAVSYLIAKQMQAKNINIALTCLRNKLPKNMAFDLMRDTF